MWYWSQITDESIIYLQKTTKTTLITLYFWLLAWSLEPGEPPNKEQGGMKEKKKTAVSIEDCWGTRSWHFSKCLLQVTCSDPDIPVSLQRNQDLCHPFSGRREIKVDRVTVTCSIAVSWECNSVDGGHMPQLQGSDTSHRSPSAFLQTSLAPYAGQWDNDRCRGLRNELRIREDLELIGEASKHGAAMFFFMPSLIQQFCFILVIFRFLFSFMTLCWDNIWEKIKITLHDCQSI